MGEVNINRNKNQWKKSKLMIFYEKHQLKKFPQEQVRVQKH